MPDQRTITGSTAREIASSVEAAVGSGRLAAGEPLPAVRALAASLGVSPTTVAAAWADLRRRGVVVTRPRSGTRVAARPLTAPTVAHAVPQGVRDLSAGNPDPALLPDVLGALARLGGPPRLYGEATVDAGLRAVAAAALAADGIDASELCVVNGALDGIERALTAHLVAGDAVAVEDPGFAAVVDVVRALGLRPVPMAVDARGPRPQALRAAVGEGGARAVVITPRGQNPTGAALDAGRARELRAALPAGVLAIEDDHLGPVAGVDAHTVTAGHDRWLTVRSTSKWLGPDLRLAVATGDATTVSRVAGRQAVGPGWVSTLLQRAVAALWADEDAAALAEQAATVYAGRRRALLAALAEHGLSGEGASGLNVWVAVPDEPLAVSGLLAMGWAVAAGERFRLRSGAAIRVTTATLRPAEAARLAADLAAVLAPSTRTRAA